MRTCHPRRVHLGQLGPGRYGCRAGGQEFAVILLGGGWVVYVDGVERFSAARLQTAERKIEEWLAR